MSQTSFRQKAFNSYHQTTFRNLRYKYGTIQAFQDLQNELIAEMIGTLDRLSEEIATQISITDKLKEEVERLTNESNK